jgi:lipopolysaccharide export system ATP-binding protein
LFHYHKKSNQRPDAYIQSLFLLTMSVTIETRGLVKKYGKRTVVNQVSIEVKQGEIVGLLGPNGAGKTTSFYQVVGLIKPDEGRVYLNKEDITQLPMYKRAQMGIGYLPQEPSVFRKLSVEDNIAAILEMTRLTKKQQKDKLELLLNELRLQHVRKNNGDVLSGGERRRTEIARALSVDPKFILLDEPFAGIDPIAVEDIQAIVARLKYKNIGVLITDHNVTETLSICDRAYLLIEGKIFKHGTAEELAADEDVRRLYLGRNFELKRKDYLHEEAIRAGEESLSSTPVPSTPGKNVHLTLFINHVIERTQACIRFADSIHLFHSFGGYAFDMKFDEYCQQLTELKSAVLKYAEEKNDKEIQQKAEAIKTLRYKDYKIVFEIENWIKNMWALGIVLGWLFRLPFFMKIRKLKAVLHENYALLGSLSSQVDAS